MADKNTEKLGNVTIDRLGIGKIYKVHYSCFKKVKGSRGDFMSASFIIENDKGVKVWVSTPNERSAYKAIGVMTGARINGNKVSIDSLTVEKNGKYYEFVFGLKEYISEINEDEFEDITPDGDVPF